jgi:hypothetical protein
LTLLSSNRSHCPETIPRPPGRPASAPDPAAAGHAGVLAEDVPAHHGLVIVERDLHWTPVNFGEIAARL